MKRKSEQFGHESFLGQNCPESKLQKRAFIKLIFYVFCDFRIDKGVHELLGHPLEKWRLKCPNPQLKKWKVGKIDF